MVLSPHKTSSTDLATQGAGPRRGRGGREPMARRGHLKPAVDSPRGVQGVGRAVARQHAAGSAPAGRRPGPAPAPSMAWRSWPAPWLWVAGCGLLVLGLVLWVNPRSRRARRTLRGLFMARSKRLLFRIGLVPGMRPGPGHRGQGRGRSEKGMDAWTWGHLRKDLGGWKFGLSRARTKWGVPTRLAKERGV